MKAEYKNDPDKGPGYGLVVFTESLFPSAPWTVSLQRSSDGKFLVEGGNGQWVGESAFFPLQGTVSADGATLELFLDPQVIDSLDQQEQYRISLKGSDGEAQRARLKLNPITFSRDDHRDNTARLKREAQNAQTLNNDRESSLEKNRAGAGENPPIPTVSGSAAPTGTENLEMPETVDDKPKKPKRWILVLLALIVAGSLLGFFLLKSMPEKNVDTKQQNTAEQDSKKPESVEEQVRKFFAQGSPTAQGALALAQALPKTSPADQDAVYRLFYYAYGNNDPQSYLPYADCLNPALPKWGTIIKNAPDALEAYEKARQDNPEAAQKAIDDMLAWLEKQSAEGNEEARDWLARIKK